MAFIRTATVIRHEAPGTGTASDAEGSSTPRKRKVSRILRPIAKAQRRLVKAHQVFGDELERRQEKSASKKRNGAVKDGGKNHLGALRKAVKKLVD